jgi:hypothetical protein
MDSFPYRSIFQVESLILHLRGSSASKTTFSHFLHSSALEASWLCYLWNLGLWWHMLCEFWNKNWSIYWGSIWRVLQFPSFLSVAQSAGGLTKGFNNWDRVSLPEDLTFDEIILHVPGVGAAAPLGQIPEKCQALDRKISVVCTKYISLV